MWDVGVVWEPSVASVLISLPKWNHILMHKLFTNMFNVQTFMALSLQLQVVALYKKSQIHLLFGIGLWAVLFTRMGL